MSGKSFVDFVYSFVDLVTKKFLNPGEKEHQEHEEPQRTQEDISTFAAFAVHGTLGNFPRTALFV